LLSFVLPIPPQFGFLLVFLGIALAFFRYAYKILDQTAMGLLTPGQHELYDDSDNVNLPYKQFGILFVISFVIGLADNFGGLFFGAALIYGTLSIPATIMILAITRSFWTALNPLAVFQLITSIGIPYLGLSAFIFLLGASQSVLQGILAPYIPPWMMLPVFTFISLYFTLIMFNMMGYVIYQYHHLLGVQIKNPDNGVGGNAVAKTEKDSFAELIASGQIAKALDQAYEEKRLNHEDVSANDRYYKLLLLSDNEERLLSHVRSYLALLLKKDLTLEALQVFIAMRERTPGFGIEEPALLLQLARAARQKRDPDLALSLLKGFDKRFPGSKEIPEVYFFAAQTLSENLHKDATARQILLTLLKRYPSHPVSNDARNLLSFLDKMATQS
jgi:tetratricopeptide (TPR) repeat protein